MTARCVAVVQARMRSQRLPGKVLADVEGRPVLGRMLDRLQRLQRADELVVATSVESADDPVADYCARRAVGCVRGHATDVLDRFLEAARHTGAEIVIRLTGDCPLIDPALVDACVEAFTAASPPVDLVVNRLPWARTYPIGLDTEVFSRQALEIAWRQADEPHQREHVVPYLYENPDRFRMLHLQAPADHGRLRWTVDTAEDLEVVRRIYRAFDGGDDFGWLEVVALYARMPELARLNAGVVHRDHRAVDSSTG